MRQPSTRRDGGFTLIELLVVVAIIVLLIGLLVPAASSARNSARRAKTTATMTGIQNATFSFKTANQRVPGVFTQDELGSSANATMGLTAMENALLELSGGVLKDDEYDGGDDSHIELSLRGPGSTQDTVVYVDVDAVGAQGGADYYTSTDSEFSAVTGQTWSPDAGMAQMPDLIDPWGTPIMLWVRNDLTGSINPCGDSGQDFAQINSPTSQSADRAWFYWNTNAGYLSATQLGQYSKNQNTDSLLGGSRSDSNREDSMRAFLGHPAFPCESDPTLPAQTYGDVLFQSAAQDSLYFGAKPSINTLAYPGTVGNLPTDALLPEKTDDLLVAGS